MCFQFQRDRATLARAYDVGPNRGLEYFLGEVVLDAQENYDRYWDVWVFSDDQRAGKCTALRDYKIVHVDCDLLLPYICERGEYNKGKNRRKNCCSSRAITKI